MNQTGPYVALAVVPAEQASIWPTQAKILRGAESPRASFLSNCHIEVLAAKLQAAREGKIERQIIHIPPRYFKSLAASIALPAWGLGHDPTCAIINVTYGQELSDKFARDCHSIMMSSWYRTLFATRLAMAT
ncbi:MAG: hypothetical protein ACREC0_05345 [Methylocella sp.]